MADDKAFETAQEAADRLGMSVRAVQKQAAEGRIPGAQKQGKSWMIPQSYASREREDVSPENNGVPDVYQVTPFRLAMPLLNSVFTPGKVMEHINSMQDEDDRRIALAEYYFFSGRAEEAAKTAEPYLDSHDPALRFSSNLICTFANLGRGHSHLAQFAMGNLQRQVRAGLASDAPPQFHAIGVFTATAAAVLLHLPLQGVPPLDEYLRYLPGGLKLYACYILAHKAYLEKDYTKCLTIADIALSLVPMEYPIAMVYLHIVAAMGLMNLKRTEDAKYHMEKAWQIAKPDELIQPFGEHHGLLQGMIEIYFRKEAPEVLPRIIDITYAFSASWRKVHNVIAQHDVADNLTTTEFTIAMLYNRGWSAKEIAVHMDMSPRTVTNNIQIIYQKLGISRKSELAQFMLY